MNFWNSVHTVRNLHFLSKNSTLISSENCRFFGWKNSWKCCDFWLFSCWQLSFHEKNRKKKLSENLVKLLGFCQNWILGQKFDFSNSVYSNRFKSNSNLINSGSSLIQNWFKRYSNVILGDQRVLNRLFSRLKGVSVLFSFPKINSDRRQI